MSNEYYCPQCGEVLEVMNSWGSLSYFCTECKRLVSRSKKLTKEEMEEKFEIYTEE